MDDDRKIKTGGHETEGGFDVALLSEAVAELSISRKSVGLYPPGHERITGAIERAYGLLQLVLAERSDVTLTVGKDTLIVDKAELDRRNPVFVESARFFYGLGLSSIRFGAGLEPGELTALHELMTDPGGATGQDLAERARQRGLTHIRLTPIDYEAFGFVQGERREGARDEEALWEDYVESVVEGRLPMSGDLAPPEGMTPERLAEVINRREGSGLSLGDEALDRLLGAYVGGPRSGRRLSPKTLDNLLGLIRNLAPALKESFIRKGFEHMSKDAAEAEGMLTRLDMEQFARLTSFVTEHMANIPDTMRNLIFKFSEIKDQGGFNFDMVFDSTAVVHDIELGPEIVSLFDDDHFDKYVSGDYKFQLERMIEDGGREREPWLEGLDALVSDDVLENAATEIMIEVIEDPSIPRSEYMMLITRLTELAGAFLRTGRFEELLNLYNSIYSHSLHGQYGHEARSTIEYFFHTDEFISRIIDAFLLWGRSRRIEVQRLLRVMKRQLIGPLFETLATEPRAANRKFLLETLVSLGEEAAEEAVKRLKDPHWYVTRNMLYLIRHADGKGRYVSRVRSYAKHEKPQVCMEAIRGLLGLKAKDAPALLRFYAESDDLEMREQALKLVGAYKVASLAPRLIELLEKKEPPATFAEAKAPIIRALAVLGDPRAVPALTRLFRSRSLFKKPGLKEVRAVILETLHRYPRVMVMPIIGEAMKTGDDAIAELAAKVMKRLDAIEHRGEAHEGRADTDG